MNEDISKEKMKESMRKLLLDMGPIALFFIVYNRYDLIMATGVLVIATLVSLGVTYMLERKVHTAPIISAVIITIFGGLTIALNDELFIKIKPTIINLLFAAVLLGGVYIFKRGLLKYVLEMALSLNDEGWRVLSARWGYFFIFLAVLNEVIWRNFSTDFWVNFKVFGMLTCTIIFTAMQIRVIKRYGE